MQADIYVVKSSECNSLSAKSQLTYEFGRKEVEEGVYIRIARNSGGGMFCDQWVPMSEVLTVLRETGNGEAITSVSFRRLYLGRSINTQSFLMAVLKHEEVITDHASKRRGYQVFDLGAFEERINALSLLPVAIPAPSPEVTPEPVVPAETPSVDAPKKKRR